MKSLLTLLTLSVTLPIMSAAAAPAMQPLAAVEGISEYRLDNGLRVLLFPDDSKQTITVNMTYLVGSRHESYGETGMAHLLEHMLFKGSPKHRNIPAELSAHGARPNGTTWYDRTNYFETFAATDENLQWALSLEADRMVNSFVAKKDLDTEMTVVRNEFESGENNPGNVLEERMMSTAYLWHNYGHPAIGARADIENVPIERLQAFYKRYYQPDNAVLLVTGKIDSAKTLQSIKQHFASIPKPLRSLPKLYTQEPTQDGEREVTLRRTGDVQIVGAAYHLPSGVHADFAALNVLIEILGAEPAGRLYQALVATKQAASVRAYAYQLHDPGMALMFADVRQGESLQQARATLLNTIETLAANPPSKQEVDRARNQLLKQIELQLNATDRIGLELSEWIAMGDWRLFFLHRDNLRKVLPADVQRVAAAYLKSSNRTLGSFIPTAQPDRAEIPNAPEVATLVKGYQGDAAKAQGENFDPSPTNIDARTQWINVQAGGVQGIKLALLPKKTRGESVAARLVLHFGAEQSLFGRSTSGELVADMLMRGTSKHTRQQLSDELDRLKARVAIDGNATTATVMIETQRPQLAEVLQLVAEMLREANFPADEFELLQRESLSAIEQQRTDPQALARIALQQQFNRYPKGDVRYVQSLDEQIAGLKAVTLQQVQQFHREFYGAQGELSVIGDFDASQVRQQIESLFAGWRSLQPFVRVPNVYQAVPQVDRVIATPDKSNAVYLAGMSLQLRDDNPDYPALVLANYILGGGFLNSRLATRIRQQEGLSYGVGSQFNASALDQFGSFLVYAIYAPQNLQKLDAAIKQELQRALQQGFTAAELQAAKSGWLQAQQVSRAQDNELARKLADYLFLDRRLTRDAGLEKQVAALTPEQVTEALRRHVDLSRFSFIKAGDFAEQAPASTAH